MKKGTKKNLMWGAAALGAIYYWQKNKSQKAYEGATSGSGMDAFMSEISGWVDAAGGKLSASEIANLRAQLLPGVTNSDIEKYSAGANVEPSGYTQQDKMLIEQAVSWA